MTALSHGLADEEVFTLLSNSRRLAVLRYLADEAASVSMKELTNYIASRENDIRVEHLESQQYKRVYVSLYQTHIPHLDEAGVLVHDEADDVIELLPDARATEQLYEHLDVSPGDDVSGSETGVRSLLCTLRGH